MSACDVRSGSVEGDVLCVHHWSYDKTYSLLMLFCKKMHFQSAADILDSAVLFTVAFLSSTFINKERKKFTATWTKTDATDISHASSSVFLHGNHSRAQCATRIRLHIYNGIFSSVRIKSAKRHWACSKNQKVI